MNRRAMFRSALLLPVAAASMAAKPTPADEHIYKGYRVRWAGWQQPPNQFGSFGYWVAHGDRTRHGQPVYCYATTFGVFDVAMPTEVIDTHIEWKDSPVMPEPHERDGLKARALRLLYDHL